jgi:hypothetical protein
MRMVSVGGHGLGVFAVGQFSTGIIAIGQEATGVIAIGQVANGVFAVGQLSRGVIAVGQLSFGLAAAGQLAAGVVWSPGLGIGGTGNFLAYGLFGTPNWRRLIARVRGEPWDSAPRWPAWRLAVSTAGLAALATAWWLVAGHPLIAALT